MDKRDLEMLRNLERIRNISMNLAQKMKREYKPAMRKQELASGELQFTYSTFTPNKFEPEKFKPEKFKFKRFKES